MITRKLVTKYFQNVIDNILIFTYNENPTLNKVMTYEEYRDYILSEYNEMKRKEKKQK